MKALRQVAVFIILGVIASYFLLPSRQEVEAMRFSADASAPSALAGQRLSEQLLSEQLLSEHSAWSTLGVHSLAQKYVANKQIADAIALMEGFVERHPTDVEALKFLASLYQQAERYEIYCTTLETVAKLDPSLDVLHQLTDLYQMLGMQEKEYALLERLVKEGQALPRERLSFALYLAQQQPASATAADMMLEVFHAEPESLDMVARQTLLRQLVVLSRREEAMRVLRGTYAGPVLSHEGLAMAEWLTNGVDQGLAREFLVPFKEVAAADAEWFARVLRDLGSVAQLEQFWVARLNDPTLDEEAQKQIINGLIDVGAAAHTLEFLPQKALSGEQEWLWLYRHALEQSGQLPQWQGFLAKALLEPGLASKHLHTFATLLIEEAPVHAADVLANAWKRAPVPLLAAYLQALERLPGAALRAEAVINILDNVALKGQRRQALLALLIRANPQAQGVAWLRNAALNGDDEALVQFEAWLQVPGRESQWRDWCVAQVDNTQVTVDKQRQYAHALLKAGHKLDAMGAFQRLAEQSGPEGSDIRTLLYLVGPRPDVSVVTWMEQQAKNAQGDQQLAWFSHLLSVGASRQVLALTAPPAGAAHHDVMLKRLSAFADLHDEPAFSEAFALVMKESPSASWLEQVARLAQEAGFAKPAGIAFDTLCQREPHRVEECREAGRLAFARGDFTLARTALSLYEKNAVNTRGVSAHADAESLFYLAESHAALGEREEASRHYGRALSLLDAGTNADTDLKSLRLRAYLLFKLGRNQDANVAYEALLKRYPQAADIKADYVASLLDQQFYDRALHVLE